MRLALIALVTVAAGLTADIRTAAAPKRRSHSFKNAIVRGGLMGG